MTKALFFISLFLITFGQGQSITAKLNEINFQGSSTPYYTLRYKNQLIFTAEDGDTGRELWSYDFGTGKSKLVKDIFPFSNSGIDNNPHFNILNDKVFFLARSNFSNYWLFSTDGTEAGTQYVFPFPSDLSFFQDVVLAGNKIYFLINYQLWVSDGTDSGTKKLKTFGSYTSGSVNLRVFGNKVVTAIDDGINGKQVWISDGTTDGTFLLKKISNTGSAIGNDFDIVDFNNKFYFFAYDTESAVWESDGTTAGTKKFTNKVRGNFMQGFSLGNSFVFGGTDSAFGAEPWVSDGTVDGTKLIKDVVSGVWGSIGINSKVVRYRNKVAFDVINNSGDYQIWETDGTTDGTRQIPITDSELDRPLLYKSSSNYQELILTRANNGSNFWLYNDEKGLFRIPNATPTIYTDEASNFIDGDDFLYLTASTPENGAELFKVNKQTREISLLSDANTSQSSDPKGFIRNSNGLIVVANNGLYGNQFFKINPETGEKNILNNLKHEWNGEMASLSNSELIKLGNDIYQKGTYNVGINNNNYSLFAKTDGTFENTIFVKYADNMLYDIGRIFENLNDEYLIFSANDSRIGTELFRIKKGATEIELLKDISTDENGGLYNLDSQTVITGGYLYFIAKDNNIRTIWRTDGTPENTKSVISFLDENSNDGDPKLLGALNGKILISKSSFYNGSFYNSNLYISDGTQSGTTLLKNHSTPYFYPDVINNVGAEFKNKFYYTTSTALYQTDGTPENTKNIYQAGNNSDYFRNHNKILTCGENLFIGSGSRYSSYYDGTYDKIYALWKTNDNNQTELVHKVENQSGEDNFIKDLKCINNYVYFTKTNDNKLWRTNGRATENVSLTINVSNEDAFNTDKNEFLGDLFVDENKLLFTAVTKKSGLEYYQITSELPVYLNIKEADNSVQNIKILLYPNPASEFIKVKYNIDYNPESYKIYNMAGNIVSSGKYTQENQTIDVSKINKGLYVIEIKSKDGILYSQKFIKN
ncbi:T9SS type A sorting domain-containing protein [Epilithonimonas zeae]|uniref:T9SS type A sorting domain-containing protein n=1 Tax=Epilithonimonas zeae TaxID=1416779 RepID=UPI00200EF587|nr:T9SS type A sorting domain-containing protein [Epilithonimonas zeae]UQB68417.1 T9SS type A sorting domain-containing protein [Epilithonimonas zeae]